MIQRSCWAAIFGAWNTSHISLSQGNNRALIVNMAPADSQVGQRRQFKVSWWRKPKHILTATSWRLARGTQR